MPSWSLVFEVWYMVDSITINVQWRLWTAVDCHILCFGGTDDKSEVREMEDSSKAMSDLQSVSRLGLFLDAFLILVGALQLESRSDDLSNRWSTKMMKRNGAITLP